MEHPGKKKKKKKRSFATRAKAVNEAFDRSASDQQKRLAAEKGADEAFKDSVEENENKRARGSLDLGNRYAAMVSKNKGSSKSSTAPYVSTPTPSGRSQGNRRRAIRQSGASPGAKKSMLKSIRTAKKRGY